MTRDDVTRPDQVRCRRLTIAEDTILSERRVRDVLAGAAFPHSTRRRELVDISHLT